MAMRDSVRLGDILIGSGMVAADDIQRAVDLQVEKGGRLGDNLVAMGVISAEQLSWVLNSKPSAPRSMKDTGIPAGQLLKYLIKTMSATGLETPTELKSALKLPAGIITQLLEEAVDRRLIQALADSRYALSNAGQQWAKELFEQNQYVGPVPVSLDDFHERVKMQRITNERIDQDRINDSMSNIVVTDKFIDSLGPAINSGQCILLYGPPGNGKTTVAEKIGKMFRNVIYVPYAVEIDGEVMKVYDMSLHQEVGADVDNGQQKASLIQDDFDERWVPCRRPVVMVGGELTLDMLDLSFNHIAKFYEAPLHVKALGGTFIIDDFGRQFVKPTDLLNRWIVPLESRIDFLKLHTGKAFTIPFDELVIFSTNLSPSQLMDPAFLRRIPYKLKTKGPDLSDYKKIFENVSRANGLEFDEDLFAAVVRELRENSRVELACYQPKFIADQVIAQCKYMGLRPRYSMELIQEALGNLYVKDDDSDVPSSLERAA